MPELYAGSDDHPAAAETIFHRLAGRGRPRRIPLARYRSWQWSLVDADGPLWVSRQLHDRPSTAVANLDSDGLCLLLVTGTAARSGGVARHDLTADGPALPFASTTGLERLDVIGDALGVTITRT